MNKCCSTAEAFDNCLKLPLTRMIHEPVFWKKANVVTVFKEGGEGTAWWRSNDRSVGLIAVPG